MSVPNRSELINKTYKVLKKHYEPCKPPTDRSLLEHLLYACCLENAQPVGADEALAKLQQAFFDWNEVRVTTVPELAETMAPLPEATSAAARLKQALQYVFEKHYAFDIEYLRKQNLGKSIKDLEAVRGISPFVVAYVTQHGLGGHAIPISQGTLGVLAVLGVITEAEAKKHKTPGLERAVPKAKGIEFASLLHQLGAEFHAAPLGSKVKAIVTEVDPQAKDRLPKRPPRTEEPPAPATPAESRETRAKPRDAAKAEPAKSPAAAEPPPAPADAAAARKKRPKSGEPPAAEAAEAAVETAEAGPRRSPTKQLTRKKPR